MECLKDIVDILNALLVPMIAMLASYIAWQQFRLGQRSFNNQTYEKKLPVFRAFMSFLSDLMRDGKTNYSRCRQFYSETSEALFLCSDAIISQREEMYKKSLALVLAHEKMYPADHSPGLPVGIERSQVAHENAELLGWFGEQIKVLTALFKEDMKIS